MAKEKKVENKTESELQKELYRLRQDLLKLHKDKIEGDLKQTHKIKQIKKEIARVLTKLNQLKNNG